ELVGRNARPRVAYASLDAAVGETAGRCPHVSGRGELDGVVEQVAEHPPELHAVRPNPDRGVDDVADEADSLRLRDRPQVGALIGQHLAEGELALVELDLAGVEAGEV